jgi:alkylation response protein AidB-like acyl-CoA dehydrogenase
MDFDLSDDQLQFRTTLRDFLEDRVRPVAREWEQAGRYPAELVAVLAELGLFGMTIPEEYGGLALDMVSLAVVFEEIASVWMGLAGVLGSHSLACRMITFHGTPEQKDRYLPELATGQRRTGLALTEPGAGTDLQGIATRAWRDGGDYVIRGTKMWITNARFANPLPVLVKTDTTAEPRHRGMSMLLVEQGLPGMEVTRDLGKLGYKGPETCEVVFDDVRVPADCLLGGVEGRGMQQALSALECGRINIAARAVGVAAASLEAAMRYTLERHAFGHPISEFQAVQLKLADMATSVEAARLMTWWAATKLDTNPRADVETAMAKLFASETAITCALDSMRLHGAHGYSTECDVERYYRDAPLMAIGEGTNDVLRIVVAEGLLRQLARV